MTTRDAAGVSRLCRITLMCIAASASACASNPSPSPTVPASAVDVEDPYQLTFTLLQTEPATGTPIDGSAAVALTAGADTVVSGSGTSMISFEYQEIGGSRHMGPAVTLDCAKYPLGVGSPIVSGLTKSGSWGPDDPNAAFYEAFFDNPAVILPPGVLGGHGVRNVLSRTWMYRADPQPPDHFEGARGEVDVP